MEEYNFWLYSSDLPYKESVYWGFSVLILFLDMLGKSQRNQQRGEVWKESVAIHD